MAMVDCPKVNFEDEVSLPIKKYTMTLFLLSFILEEYKIMILIQNKDIIVSS